jgi:hypothetical protein
MKKRPPIVVLLALILLLGACSSETSIELYEDEQWVVENVSDIDMSLMPEISVGGDILPGMGLDVGVDTGNWVGALMGGSLEELVPYYQDQGIAFSWSKRPGGGSTKVYTLRWEGQSWDDLCDVVLTGSDASVVNIGNNQVRFQMGMPVDELGMMSLVDTTVHLRAGEIVQSNAPESRSGLVTWHNPQGSMTATVTLARKFRMDVPLLAIAGGVLGVGALAGGIWWIRASSPSPYKRGRSARPYNARASRRRQARTSRSKRDSRRSSRRPRRYS